MKSRLLFVDGNLSSENPSVRTLRELGCEVSIAGTNSAALVLLARQTFDAVFMDLRMASGSRNDLVSTVKRHQPDTEVILMVDEGGSGAADQPLRLRGFPLLTKPLKAEALKPLLDSSPAPAAQEGSGGSAAPGFAGLIGSSERMRRVHRLISKVALQRHPVLITGESGTGKELVARAIHTQGPWRDQPFVPVDCGALPPTLIESELFGHVKGAFTGATQARQGLLATAGTGTVFLDEVGELPIELQSRLLRALQEHEVRPLGSNERTRLDARIVAATNQDLEAAMKRGAFRKDLFFRLNVVSIKMPPLRERKEDIPLLIRHFLTRFGNTQSVSQVSDEVMGRLLTYDWPGNVRELENCIQRAVSLGSGSFVQMQDLPSNILYRLGRTDSSRQTSTTLEALEQQAIRQALRVTGGDRVRAAKLLGIGKTTIYRKLKEYGMEDAGITPPEA